MTPKRSREIAQAWWDDDDKDADDLADVIYAACQEERQYVVQRLAEMCKKESGTDLPIEALIGFLGDKSQ